MLLEFGSAAAGAYLVLDGKPMWAAAAFAWAAFCVAWDARAALLKLRDELRRQWPPGNQS
jgi:hypothetical protein